MYCLPVKIESLFKSSIADDIAKPSSDIMASQSLPCIRKKFLRIQDVAALVYPMEIAIPKTIILLNLLRPVIKHNV